MQEIVKNINHLDYELKERFDSVLITETSNNTGFYINVVASKTIDGKTYQLVAEARKGDFINKIINWSYKSNPTDTKSNAVERTSSLDSMYIDMEDVIISRRMDKVYLDSVKDNLSMVSESKSTEETTEEPKSVISNINKILLYHDAAYFSEMNQEFLYNENVNIFIKTPYKLTFELKEQLKESTKIQIEHDILKLEYIDYIIFKNENIVEISVTE